ncbi:hypothetical protein CXB51_025196 [Gossypium anomalum]|uniref:GAG-pre-integrase domain-containing protein n=1 Tax=Gossypium anomalum TaxID=47600 RepID=A0A8J6CPM7_9ROSI|nr:hypothetical protein CXB51_025196 [Gossypium anomalum]
MASSGFSPAAPPEVVNSDVEPAPLRANPTVAQIRQHANERTKRHKAMSCIQNCVSDVIFTRIMACETPKQAWDKLKEEFQGTERIRQQQLLNLRREFENLKMKEEETVKQYSNRIMAVVNSKRLLEDSRDLTSITLTELINSLYAQEQRRASRQEEHQEGAFQAKTNTGSSTTTYKGKKTWKDKSKSDAPRKWERPCRYCKRPVCKEKGRPRQNQQQKQSRAEARVAEEGSDNEEQVFTVSCSTAQKKVSNGWLLDSGCTNHMSPDAAIFKSLDRSYKTKVKVGNGHFIKAEGKGDVVICTPTGNKIISNVLLVPEIDRNLLSIAQLVEKGYTMVFKENECQISDPNGSMLMSVAMTDKSFVVDWNKGLDSAYTISSKEFKLWHQRFGHANFRSMAQMIKEGLAENFTDSVENDDVCDVCQQGKQARQPFPTKSTWRASDKLQCNAPNPNPSPK